jgi:hypothetical protein
MHEMVVAAVYSYCNSSTVAVAAVAAAVAAAAAAVAVAVAVVVQLCKNWIGKTMHEYKFGKLIN